MKKKTSTIKLYLNKKTITILNAYQSSKIEGGYVTVGPVSFKPQSRNIAGACVITQGCAA